MRFAMFAERAVKVLEEAKAIQAMPSNEPGLTPAALRARLQAKADAEKDIATFEPALYPEDDDGR